MAKRGRPAKKQATKKKATRKTTKKVEVVETPTVVVIVGANKKVKIIKDSDNVDVKVMYEDIYTPCGCSGAQRVLDDEEEEVVENETSEDEGEDEDTPEEASDEAEVTEEEEE